MAKPQKNLDQLRLMDENARKKENRSLFIRNRKANKLLHDRYGVEYAKDMQQFRSGDQIGLNMDSRDRERVLSNLNDRLKIDPVAIDPTRKSTAMTKAISKAFMSLDDYLNTQTDELDGGRVRGEVARIREMAEKMGNDELEKKAKQFLQTYRNNDTIDGGNSFGDAMNRLREIESTIRDSYNVDILWQQTDMVYTPALPKGMAVSTGDGQVFQQTSWQDAVNSRRNSVRNIRDHANSDFELGSLTRGSDWYDRQMSTADKWESAPMPKQEDYSTDLPWWATMNG